MMWPLVILAGATLVLGFLDTPLRDFLFGDVSGHHDGSHGWVPYVATGLAILGIGSAWFEFGRRDASRIGFAERIPAVRELFAERWYLDHAYRWFVDVVIDRVLSRACAKNEEKVINDGIDVFCHFTLDSGYLLSFLQSGKLRYNLVVMFAAMAVVVLYFLLT
jgi:NADH-quinone oxidoreductase subunit L